MLLMVYKAGSPKRELIEFYGLTDSTLSSPLLYHADLPTLIFDVPNCSQLKLSSILKLLIDCEFNRLRHDS